MKCNVAVLGASNNPERYSYKAVKMLSESDYGVFGVALYGLGTMALFAGVRSLLELVLMSYPILCWFVLDRVIVGLFRPGAGNRTRWGRLYRSR